MIQRFYIILICMLAAMVSKAQSVVDWKFSARRTGKTEAILYFTATIAPGWHLYSLQQGEGGPVPTTIKLEPSEEYTENGKISEPKPVMQFISMFGMEVGYFENKAIFSKKIKLKSKQATIKGNVNFMACDETQCIPPVNNPFSIQIKSM